MNYNPKTPANLPDGCTDADIEAAWGGDQPPEPATFEECMEWLSEQAGCDITDIVLNQILIDLSPQDLYLALDSLTSNTKYGEKNATHLGAIVEKELVDFVTEKLHD